MAQFVFTIRCAERHEMCTLKQWATDLGWNPGDEDYDVFYDTDPSGYFLGFLGEELIGSVSGVKYGSEYGYIGFYIVKSEYRGKGYGLQLFQHAMKSLEGRNVGLDGVEEQQHNYIKSGFTVHYNNVRYRGNGLTGTIGPKVTNTVDFDLILPYDTIHFGTERSTFLKEWLACSETQTSCFIDEGILKGYGCIRPASYGYRIGPLFADNVDIARELLIALSSTVSEDTAVYTDIPDVNQAGVQLLRDNGFEALFSLGRMHTKGCPIIPLDHIYGSTSAELG